ncbi:MAG: hypothetical protein HUJ25_01585 [Crocinitomicaceae bacterium]|nr:hypothetical protein [Crocinitomicaceae bacterium]
MKQLKFIGVLMCLSVLLTGCKTFKFLDRGSNKLRKVATEHTIPAKQEFIIGEFQDTSYKVYVNNEAKTHIIILLVDRNTNKQTQSFRLEPTENATVFAAKFEKLIIQNHSSEEIKLKIGLNKEVEGMRYQEVKEYEQER